LSCIDANAVVAFRVRAFLDIEFDLLCILLERTSLEITEIELYDAVVRYDEELGCVFFFFFFFFFSGQIELH